MLPWLPLLWDLLSFLGVPLALGTRWASGRGGSGRGGELQLGGSVDHRARAGSNVDLMHRGWRECGAQVSRVWVTGKVEACGDSPHTAPHGTQPPPVAAAAGGSTQCACA